MLAPLLAGSKQTKECPSIVFDVRGHADKSKWQRREHGHDEVQRGKDSENTSLQCVRQMSQEADKEAVILPVKGSRSRSESILRQDLDAKSTSRGSIACLSGDTMRDSGLHIKRAACFVSP